MARRASREVVERLAVIRSLWARQVVPADDEAAFREWSLLRFDAFASVMNVVTLVCALIISVLTRALQRNASGLSEALLTLDVITVAGASVYFFMPRTRFVKSHVVQFFAACFGAMVFFGMRPFADLGGPDKPYVHLWHVVPMLTIAFPMHLVTRIAFNVYVCAVIFAGMLVPHPEYLDSPWVGPQLVILFTLAGLSVALGQCVQVLYRITFIQTQELARRGRGLEREVGQLAGRVEATQEAERARIARDLHDDLGQELAAMRFAMAATEKRFADEPAAIAPNLGEVSRMIERTTTAMQRVMAELRPRILEDLGFGAAAKWLAQGISRRSPVTCEVEIEGQVERIDDDCRAAAFRILQEALTNVLKHSHAANAKISIHVSATTLTLTVVDDGSGMGDAKAGSSVDRPAGGMGLLNMRERAKALGGTVEAGDAETGGFRVVCTLPVGADERA